MTHKTQRGGLRTWRGSLACWSAIILTTTSACATRLPHREIVAASEGRDASGAAVASDGAPPSSGAEAGTAAGADAGTAASPAEASKGSAPQAAGSATIGAASAASRGSADPRSSAASAASGGCGGSPCAPLVIASVGTYSGIVGQNLKGGVTAVQAWVTPSTPAAVSLGTAWS